MGLNDYEQVRHIIAESGGVARTSAFNAAGFTNAAVSEMCRQELIVRIRSGYYTLSQQNQNEEEIIAELFPDGIVCQDSALFYYGYSDRTPLEWHLAFPRTVTRSRFEIDYPPVRAYLVQKNILGLGKTIGHWNDTDIAVYDRERTICDCFKRKPQMDSEVFVKAVNAYAVDEKRNLSNLSCYAKQLRVNKKVTEIMEVLIGG